MKKTIKKPRDLPFDELIRQLCRWCDKTDKRAGTSIKFTLEFRPPVKAAGEQSNAD